jgi:hypothetical protein
MAVYLVYVETHCSLKWDAPQRQEYVGSIKFDRVEMWLGGGVSGLSVSARFVWPGRQLLKGISYHCASLQVQLSPAGLTQEDLNHLTLR